MTKDPAHEPGPSIPWRASTGRPSRYAVGPPRIPPPTRSDRAALRERLVHDPLEIASAVPVDAAQQWIIRTMKNCNHTRTSSDTVKS